jgi:hypothetical protein
MNAYRTDGLPQPPDFVTGPAAPELASQILKLIAVLRGPCTTVPSGRSALAGE